MTYAARPMGDYKTYGYAGDPGWLSSIWKGVKKLAPRIIGGLVGGPVGAIITGATIGGAVVKATSPRPPALPAPGGAIGGAVSFPGGTTVSGAFALPTHAGMGQHAPSGYHLDKATGTRWVKNRRMNVANPRALRKALRRTDGFVKLAKRSLKGTGYAVRRA